MNRFMKYSKILAAFAIVFFATACDDVIDTPPVVELDPNSILTVAELREICPPGSTYRFTEDRSLFATITMDESTGNIYKQLYVQDDNHGVELRLSASSRLRQGDVVRVNLNGSLLSYYNSQFQVSGVDVKNVVFQESGINKEPILVTIDDLNEDDFSIIYQSKLVVLENVQFELTELGKTYADAVNQSAEDRVLEDANGDKIIVRTSGFASFANQKVPEGNGSIIAIATQYRDKRQLIIRKLSEVDLNGERF